MARINIEQSIFSDARFIQLCIKRGGMEQAIGSLIMVWIVAQKYYLSHGEIPSDVWLKQNLSEDVVICGLAERSLTGVRVKGQDEQFAWLKQASDAGRKSVEKRRKTKGGAQPKPRTPIRKKPEPPLTAVEGISTSSSSSFSPSSSISSSGSEIPSESEAAESQPAFPVSPVSDFIGAYCRGWKARYGTNPEMGGKPAGIAVRLVKKLGSRAIPLVEQFLQMEDFEFTRAYHDLEVFERCINKVKVKLDTGMTILPRPDRMRNKAEEISEYNRAQLKAVERGEL